MKRNLPAHSVLPRLAALLVLLSPLGVLGMLGCAGLPEAVAGELAQARSLVEIGSPDSLERAAALLSAPELADYEQPRSLGGLAELLYDFLYPEFAGSLLLPAGFTAAPETLELFALAAGGRPPAQPAVGEAYFDLLLPALYAARRPSLSQDEAATLRPAVEQAGRLNPRAVPPLYLGGLLAETLEEDVTARELYRRSLELEGSFYPAHRRLADLEYAAGDLEAAAAHLQALHQLGLAGPALLKRLARVYLQSSRPDQAEALVAEELIRSPRDRELLLLRSEILEARGDWLQALKPVELILKQQPDDRAARLRKAGLLAAHGRDPEELLRYLRGLDIGGDPELLELSGKALLAAGRHEEGLKQLEQALALAPGRSSVLRALAEDAAATRRWLQAEEYLSRLSETDRSEADLLLAHRVYGSLGDQSRALEIAAALYGDGRHPEHTLLYAESLLAAGREATLHDFITANLERTADPHIKSGLLFLKARLLPAGDPELLQTLQLSLLADPDNLKTLAAIAGLYLERGDTRKARNYLRRAVALNPLDASLSVQFRQLEPAP
jgi:Tfp pilus assembly protein PilF